MCILSAFFTIYHLSYIVHVFVTSTTEMSVEHNLSAVFRRSIVDLYQMIQRDENILTLYEAKIF